MMDKPKRKLRSQAWYNNPENPGMTALYLERQLSLVETVIAFDSIISSDFSASLNHFLKKFIGLSPNSSILKESLS